tara:strand:- start:326 stop:562 length:237 start_codon:yes stop_codon:yes gene_type:complete
MKHYKIELRFRVEEIEIEAEDADTAIQNVKDNWYNDQYDSATIHEAVITDELQLCTSCESVEVDEEEGDYKNECKSCR